MTTHDANPTEPTAAGDEAVEVEGHNRRSRAVPSDQTSTADPAGGGAPEAGEEGEDVEGHFFTTNPYLVERAAEGRRGQLQAEAERDRQANQARKAKR